MTCVAAGHEHRFAGSLQYPSTPRPSIERGEGFGDLYAMPMPVFVLPHILAPHRTAPVGPS